MMRQGPQLRHTVIALATVVACSGCEPPRPMAPMLHALPAFSGEVDVTVPGQAPVRYELSFARSNGYFSVKIGSGKDVVTLLHDAHGERATRPESEQVRAFQHNTPRAATAREREQFARIRALIAPRDPGDVEPGGKGYRVRLKGGWHDVRLVPEAPGYHGGPTERR